MKRARWFGLAALVVAACALLARSWRHADGLQVGDRRLQFALDWPRGTTYRYAFAWRADSEVKASQASPPSTGDQGEAPVAITGHADLGGEMTLVSSGRSGDTYRLTAKIEALPVCDLQLLGREVLVAGQRANEELVGREAVVEMDPDGHVRTVYFTSDAPPFFRYVMATLLQQTQVVVHAQGVTGWTARETTPLGEGTASYEVESLEPPRLVREREPYGTVLALPGRRFSAGEQNEDARAEITLDRRGIVASVAEDERLGVRAKGGRPGDDFTATDHFSWELRSVGIAAPADRDLAALDPRTPGKLVGPADAEQQMLDQRIHGLTAEQMRVQLFAFGRTGHFPTKDWLLQASGLLTQHPELCMDMVTLFEDEAMTDRGRAQIANLLAGTGTAEAQDALREVIASPVTRGNADLARSALQSFLIVAHPTADSLAFLADAFGAAKAGSGRYSAALALGAAAGNALRSGNGELARRYDSDLRDALARASSAREKRDMLDALGNVGAPEDVSVIRSFRRDADAAVRSSAAFALRKIDTADARDALVSFAGDPSPDVEASAFDALGRESLGQEDVVELSRLVTTGGTKQQSDSALLSLLTAHEGQGGEPVRAMLRFLMSRNGADGTMMAELRHALAATS